MRVHSHLNLPHRIEHISEAQFGYFTRAQAHLYGIEDYELARGTDYGQIVRVGHGVYRVVGAPADPLEDLRMAWLRLDPASSPRQRTRYPQIWVSHRSATRVLNLGVYLAGDPEFTSIRKLQPRFPARIRVRSGGLRHDEWVVRRGFAVTSVARTLTDLAKEHGDRGHLGHFAADALRTGAATAEDLDEAVAGHIELDVLLAMAEK
jgi:hypothetical protein